MGILGVRSCRKSDWFMTSRKLNVEPSNQRVYEVVPSAFQDEWGAETQIGRLDSIEIDRESCRWLCDARFHLNGVNEWFGQGSML